MTVQTGTIYMLHFDRPYQHARHYVGWTDNLKKRLARHRKGAGSRLIAVITKAGIGFTVARTVIGDRGKERAIHNAGGSVRYCPICTPHPLNGNWASKK